MDMEVNDKDDDNKIQETLNEPLELDVSKLTPLDPRVISKQATINIGTIGHVAHGKSTIVRAISGVQTVRFKNEKERNITIKLGYANAKLYECQSEDCPAPMKYASYGSSYIDNPPCRRPGCTGTMKVVRHVSFVDCPGHDILMATMLNGAAVMDAALLLIAGNEPCPQPQTSEHLAAVEIMKLHNIMVLQNKVELSKPEKSQLQYEQIRDFIRGTAADKAPIVPVSAVLKYNIDVVIEYLITQVPVPIRDFTSAPQMIIIRSFDVNKPGEKVENLVGGVAGGSLLKGVFRLGDEVECRPGIVVKASGGTEGVVQVRPIRSTIQSLHAEENQLQFAVPGGLIGVGTNIDPTLTRADKLVGQVLGLPGHMPSIMCSIKVWFYLLRRVLGIKPRKQVASSSAGGAEADAQKSSQSLAKQDRVTPIREQEFLLINVGSTSVGGRVQGVKEDQAKIQLASPVCCSEGDKVAISRRVDKHWRLIGWGQITKGSPVEILEVL